MAIFDRRFRRRAIARLKRDLDRPIFLKTYYKTTSALRRRNIDIWFLPQRPIALEYSIVKICAELGLQMTSALTNNTALGIAWDDKTTNPVHRGENGLRVINQHCTDISKRRVEATFERVFGYPLGVDPTTYEGMVAEKTDENAIHRGRVIKCPISAPEPGRVYEILINNVIKDCVEDIRVPIMNGHIPLAYLKRRWTHERFDNTNFAVDVVDVHSAFSRDEQTQISLFAAEMHMDFGELDILRDRKSGLIYIVDANKTPSGPPWRLNFFAKTNALRRLARDFEAQFMHCLND